jgi:hypothetical protein
MTGAEHTSRIGKEVILLPPKVGEGGAQRRMRAIPITLQQALIRPSGTFSHGFATGEGGLLQSYPEAPSCSC